MNARGTTACSDIRSARTNLGAHANLARATETVVSWFRNALELTIANNRQSDVSYTASTPTDRQHLTSPQQATLFQPMHNIDRTVDSRQ